MKCSVIVPYANVGDRIIKLINSLQNQDFEKKHFEMILINNGEKDDLEELLKSTNTKMNYKLLFYPGCGRSKARNYGIDAAIGELCIFIDGDEAAPKNFLSSQYKLYSENGHSIMQIGFKKQMFLSSISEKCNDKELLKVGERFELDNPEFYGLTDICSYYYINDIRHKMLEYYENDFSKIKYKMVFTQSSNMAIPKAVLKKYGGFDDNFKGWGVEDWEIGYRMMKNNVEIKYNPDIEVLHFYHVSNYDKKRFLEWKNNLDYMLKKYNDPFLVNLKEYENFFDPIKRKEIKEKYPTINLWTSIFENIEKCPFNKRDSYER